MKHKKVFKTTTCNREYKVFLKNTIMTEKSFYSWCGACRGPCGLASDCFYPYRFKRMLRDSKRGEQQPRYKNINRRSLKDFN